MTSKASLQYIEIDVPNFVLVEGRAFDGVSDYLLRGAELTGAADSKQVTGSFWLHLTDGVGAAQQFIYDCNPTSLAFQIFYDPPSSQIRISGSNAANTIIVSLRGQLPTALGQWVHILFSFDLATAAAHIYINDVDALVTPTTLTNDTLDLTGSNVGIAASSDASALTNGALAEFWIDYGVFVDFSIEARRREFISAGGFPAAISDDGSTATLSQPILYLSAIDGDFATNQGSGGDFTVTGGPSAAFVKGVGRTSLLGTETFLFTLNNVDFAPPSIDAIPAINSISFSPSRISLGQNLGERSVLTISLRDFNHIFNGEDFNSGTFFGKWRARYLTRLRNRELRWYQGELGQVLEDMTLRTYLVDSVDGPDTDGTYKIVAKDVLKLTDDERSQAPLLNNGFLLGNITSGATSATLSPSGIGDLEYAASGEVAIGGEEIASFTRSGDVLTLTRGQLGTTAVNHEAGDRVQELLRFSGEDPADIIRDLFVTYGGVDSAFINLTAWKSETAANLAQLYTANIAEPVGVKQLVSELVEQAALSIWWDAVDKQIKLRVLKQILTGQTFDETNTLARSLAVTEQPNTRISQVWTYFGERNPLEPLDEAKNFRSVEIKTDLDAETEFGSAAIKKVFSRWIPFGGRNVASRLNDIQLARFVDPPRKFRFRISPFGTLPALGDGVLLGSWSLQNTDGTPATVPAQITRLTPRPEFIEVEAEEALFSGNPIDLVNRVVIIDTNSFNLNLRTLHDQLFPAPTGLESPSITVTFIIEEGVTVGSNVLADPAVRTGLWVAGVVPLIEQKGRVQGHGGPGGGGGTGAGDGQKGGIALLVEDQISLDVSEGAGEIFGGGGGGGGVAQQPGRTSAGGGGGAGTDPGDGGSAQNFQQRGGDGTSETGGNGGGFGLHIAGDGGGPGLVGTDGVGTGPVGVAGQPGEAIDGLTDVTFVGSPLDGDIRGPQIN